MLITSLPRIYYNFILQMGDKKADKNTSQVKQLMRWEPGPGSQASGTKLCTNHTEIFLVLDIEFHFEEGCDV